MILHWLAGHPFQSAFQLVLLALSAAILLSGAFFLLDALGGGKRLSAGGSLLGIVAGALWVATALLESAPRQHHLGAVLLDAGMLPLMLYVSQFTKRVRTAAPPPPPGLAAPSDTVWPPPPTSLGGQP